MLLSCQRLSKNQKIYEYAVGALNERPCDTDGPLGAKFMVAHGDEFGFENRAFSPKAAFETVFDDCGKRRFTSDADELPAPHLLEDYIDLTYHAATSLWAL